MEEELLWKMVQGQIGYEFKNIDLLKQAFTRRSYTFEKGGENNEVLEFIGDRVLDFVVTKLLIEKYGYSVNGFCCKVDEDELSKRKSRMVNKKTLARRMGELGFSEYLIMGKGDVKNHVNKEDSVKEDLFEAIIGAVALDSEWNQNVIQNVVEIMLVPEDFFLNDDTDTNYVRLIQEWELYENGCVPFYKYRKASYKSTWYFKEENIKYQKFQLDYNYSRLKYHCYLKLLDSLPVFCGFGESVREARMAVCKLAYEYLERNDMLPSIRDEIENPNRMAAINQLEILARRGYFSIPTYDFSETYDENGNPVWECKCHIEQEEIYFSETSSSKKDAKKGAAYSMLCYVLGLE